MPEILSDPITAFRKNPDPMTIKVCKNCNSIVNPKRAGSGWIELVLWCFLIIPGLIYSIWRRGQRGKNVCPMCKAPHTIPLCSPAGLEIAKNTLSKPQLAELMKALEQKNNPAALKKLEIQLNRHQYLIAFVALCIIVAALSEPSGTASAPSSDNAIRQIDYAARARMICDAAHGTDEGMKYRVICGVDEANRTISLRMNTDASEASKICVYTVNEAYKNNAGLGRTWTLKILPPFNMGSAPLTECKI